MKRLKQFGAAFAVVLLAAAGIAWAQNKIPVPSSIFSAGEFVVAIDGNNIGSPTDLTGYATQMKSYTAELTPTVITASLCSEQTFTTPIELAEAERGSSTLTNTLSVVATPV